MIRQFIASKNLWFLSFHIVQKHARDSKPSSIFHPWRIHATLTRSLLPNMASLTQLQTRIIPNSISLELRCNEGECGQWPLPLLFISIYEKNKIKTLVHKRPSSSLQLVSHQNLSPRSFPCRKTYFGQDHRVPNSLQGEGNHSFLPQKSRRICTSLS